MNGSTEGARSGGERAETVWWMKWSFNSIRALKLFRCSSSSRESEISFLLATARIMWSRKTSSPMLILFTHRKVYAPNHHYPLSFFYCLFLHRIGTKTSWAVLVLELGCRWESRSPMVCGLKESKECTRQLWTVIVGEWSHWVEVGLYSVTRHFSLRLYYMRLHIHQKKVLSRILCFAFKKRAQQIETVKSRSAKCIWCCVYGKLTAEPKLFTPNEQSAGGWCLCQTCCCRTMAAKWCENEFQMKLITTDPIPKVTTATVASCKRLGSWSADV